MVKLKESLIRKTFKSNYTSRIYRITTVLKGNDYGQVSCEVQDIMTQKKSVRSLTYLLDDEEIDD